MFGNQAISRNAYLSGTNQNKGFWTKSVENKVIAFPDETRPPMANDKVAYEYEYLEKTEYLFNNISSNNSDLDNWFSNLGTAANMFGSWITGYHLANKVYNNDKVSNAFRNARVIKQARDYWYKQVNLGNKSIYDGLTNFKGRPAWTGGNFGFKGFLKAGIDPIEQFVGSFTPEIVSDGNHLTFTIKNNTSFISLMYGIGPSWSSGGPMSNYHQTYIFTEPIDFSRIP